MLPADALRDEYLAALLGRDPTRARFVVDQAVTDGMPVRDVYIDVLVPVLREVGDRWAAGELTVAHEHYATAVTLGVLGALAPHLRVPPSSGRLAVVACTPGELHAVGAQMVGDLLEGEGWEVLALGAATPGADLAALVDDERPDVVALSTAVAGNLDGAEDVLRRLRELDDPPFVVAGGRAWAGVSGERRRTLGADAFFDDPRDLTALLRTRFPPIDDD
ncbi:MAG TPA: cobalamin-dependent protein [Solirubrobacteraceae bacterium]|jgi:methanogenic corrinoid protein MtbC1|nr:cobalamin-dependent protein [Solirubrobacteraceae bacterium]